MGGVAKIIFEAPEQRGNVHPCVHGKMFAADHTETGRISKIGLLSRHGSGSTYFDRNFIFVHMHLKSLLPYLHAFFHAVPHRNPSSQIQGLISPLRTGLGHRL
jgi:hypothetical protein